MEMKSSMIGNLVAIPLLSVSSMAFAAEPVLAEPVQPILAEPVQPILAEPVLLSAIEMDGITAGGAKPGTSGGGGSNVSLVRNAVNQFILSGGGALRFGGKGGIGGDV
jgi:hypothetical protein